MTTIAGWIADGPRGARGHGGPGACSRGGPRADCGVSAVLVIRGNPASGSRRRFASALRGGETAGLQRARDAEADPEEVEIGLARRPRGETPRVGRVEPEDGDLGDRRSRASGRAGAPRRRTRSGRRGSARRSPPPPPGEQLEPALRVPDPGNRRRADDAVEELAGEDAEGRLTLLHKRLVHGARADRDGPPRRPPASPTRESASRSRRRRRGRSFLRRRARRRGRLPLPPVLGEADRPESEPEPPSRLLGARGGAVGGAVVDHDDLDRERLPALRKERRDRTRGRTADASPR